MDIQGFKTNDGGFSAHISNGKYIGEIKRDKLPKKFNKTMDYMRRENLKEFLDNPKIVSSSDTTLIVGKIKHGVNPDEVFKKDLAYVNDLLKKSPVLAMEPNDKMTPFTSVGFPKKEEQKQLGFTGGVIRISDKDITVITNDKNMILALTGKDKAPSGIIKVPNTEENKKKLLFATNPQKGKWQVEGEETMKHLATALHKFADIIPQVHYAEPTRVLAKKGFDTLSGHVQRGLGLKL